MAFTWFVERQGGRLGPYSSAQLKELAAEGRLRPDDPVRRSDQANLVAAGKIKGLFPEEVSQDRRGDTPPVLTTEHDPVSAKAAPMPPPLPLDKGRMVRIGEGLEGFAQALK